MSDEKVPETKTVSMEEHSKVHQQYQDADTRAKRFEGQIVDMETKLKVFDGIDLEKLKAHSEELDILKKEKATNSPEDIDKYVANKEAEVTSRFESTIADLQGKVDGLSGENRELKVVDKAMSALSGHFNDDCHTFVKEIIRKSVHKDAGDFVVKDDEGNVRYSKSNPTKKMDLEEYANEIAEQYPSMAKAKVPAGGKVPGDRVVNGRIAEGALQSYLRMSQEERKSRFSVADRRQLGKEASKLM